VEIIAEIIVAILQFVGELLLQILWQIIGELIGHGVREAFRKPEPLEPWLAAIGYAVLGAVGGGVSLLFVSELYIRNHWLRAANLVLTPIIVGLMMGALGAWRRRHERDVIRLESFAYGSLFALSMAIVRAWWGK
jgi:H+/Cl- antiporter ClcA